ncbi:hypothetical protein H4R20_005892, partial [Coemansia guatemalensis]
ATKAMESLETQLPRSQSQAPQQQQLNASMYPGVQTVANADQTNVSRQPPSASHSPSMRHTSCSELTTQPLHKETIGTRGPAPQQQQPQQPPPQPQQQQPQQQPYPQPWLPQQQQPPQQAVSNASYATHAIPVANGSPPAHSSHTAFSNNNAQPGQNAGGYAQPGYGADATMAATGAYAHSQPGPQPRGAYMADPQASYATTYPNGGFDHYMPPTGDHKGQEGKASAPPASSKPPMSSSSSSTSSTATAHATRHKIANTLRNRLKEGLGFITIREMAPLTILASGLLVHHFQNRQKPGLEPYKPPNWVRYAKNAMWVYSTYKTAQNNGIIKNKSAAAAAPKAGTRGISLDSDADDGPMPSFNNSRYAGGGGDRSRGLYDDSQPGVVEDDDGYSKVQMMENIVGDLFNGGGGHGNMANTTSRGLDGGSDNSLDSFDDSWAVPKPLAEEYYRCVYHKIQSLSNIETHVLGGAAAINALYSEKAMAGNGQTYPGGEDQSDYMAMGLALEEVEVLLNRKAATAPLHPNDTMENAGKVALATIIKIKAEEESIPYASQYSEPRSSFQVPAAGNNPYGYTAYENNSYDQYYPAYDTSYTGSNPNYHHHPVQPHTYRQPYQQPYYWQ